MLYNHTDKKRKRLLLISCVIQKSGELSESRK